VRIAELTRKGRDLIVPVFQKHAEMMKEGFSELNPEEVRKLEATLKEGGKAGSILTRLDKLSRFTAFSRTSDHRQVYENMERETGLEPATSSLGKWAMFCFQ
jgi:hypothetical protein